MKRLLTQLVTIACIVALHGSCANSKKVKALDEEFEDKGKTGTGNIGLNEDGVAVVRKENTAADELMDVQWNNNHLLSTLETEYSYLNRCREDLADPSLGGNEEIVDLPGIDKLRPFDEVKEEFGLDKDGNLKVVSKQDYLDTLKKARKYGENLKKMNRRVKDYRVKCERKLSYARTKAGLPSERKKAEGYFDSKGNWNETKPAE